MKLDEESNLKETARERLEEWLSTQPVLAPGVQDVNNNHHPTPNHSHHYHQHPHHQPLVRYQHQANPVPRVRILRRRSICIGMSATPAGRRRLARR